MFLKAQIHISWRQTLSYLCDRFRERQCLLLKLQHDEISAAGILETESIIFVMHSLRKADTTIKNTQWGDSDSPSISSQGLLITFISFKHMPNYTDKKLNNFNIYSEQFFLIQGTLYYSKLMHTIIKS